MVTYVLPKLDFPSSAYSPEDDTGFHTSKVKRRTADNILSNRTVATLHNRR